jgi:hypothetical protein
MGSVPNHRRPNHAGSAVTGLAVNFWVTMKFMLGAKVLGWVPTLLQD